jgi:hypothetical protein
MIGFPFAPDSRVAQAPLDRTAETENTSIRPDALALVEGIRLHDEGFDPAAVTEPKVAVQLWNVESRAMIEPPLPLETKLTAPIQLWNSFVFQLSNKRIEVWLSNILVNLWRVSRALKYIVSFTHHRWRWKLPGWRTPWVLISEVKDLRHHSW